MPEYRLLHKVYEYPLEQSNDANNGGLETPVLDTDTNIIQMTLTAQQFREFLSAIEQGAELLYPDKQHEMTDIFSQSVQ